MLTLREKQFIKTYVFGRVGTMVLLVLVIFMAHSTWRIYQKAQYAKEARDNARARLEALREREAVLAVEIERLESPRGLEEDLRQKFDVGRENEHVIVFIDAPHEQDVAQKAEPSLLQRIIEWLRGNLRN